jgi:hypothetical protein
LRQYRTVEFQRRIDQQEQEAGLRSEVRRLVVLRSPTNGKSPFSPDGPLTWSEIDTIRTGVFCPTLIPGLLPNQAVAVGEMWPIDAVAVEELTDMDKVTGGGFTMKVIGLVTVMGRQQVRMSLSGTANGIDEHGPCKHTLDGTAYYDLSAKRLSYLSLKGTHELLDGSGKSSGTIEGRFTLTRSESSAESVAGIETSPTAENSLLLYANPDLGVKFLYPRRWRVGAVQGRQLTLDGPNNSGILLTMETPKQLPSAEAYLNETLEFLRKEKGSPKLHAKPQRWADKLDRFALNAELGGEKVRMEYAVMVGRVGGVTLAARLPLADAEPLTSDWERILKSLTVLK